MGNNKQPAQNKTLNTMFTNKKLILAAAVAAQCALASNLLWFEDDNEETEYDAAIEGDDADMTEAELEHERRMLKDRNDPEKRGYFRGNYNVFGMPSFTPTGSWNFFEKPFKNVVDPFDVDDHHIERATVLKKMTEANQRPFGTAISDIARCTLDGGAVDN